MPPTASHGPQHRYELLERIGVGGMAEVFAAKAHGPHGFEKKLALKRILPAYAADERFQRRLVSEARIAATLTHSNIVSVFDCGRFGDSLYVAMELVEGLDLAEVSRLLYERARPLEVGVAIYLAIELLEGLDYAHARGVVHRDVSPSNILISRTGEVKLADFGIAKAVGEGAVRTSVGRIVGKWRYMSPEQTRGEPVDARSDLFSVGSTLFELFTGRRLFGGDDIASIVGNVRSQEVPAPSSVRAGLPRELDAPLLAALARDPAARPAQASELVRALTQLAAARSFHATALDLAALIEELMPHEVTDVAESRDHSSVMLIDDIIRSELSRRSADRRTQETSGTGARRLSEDDRGVIPPAYDEHTGTITLVVPELGGGWGGPLEEDDTAEATLPPALPDTAETTLPPALPDAAETTLPPALPDTVDDAPGGDFDAAQPAEPAPAALAVPAPHAMPARARARWHLALPALALVAVGAWWLARSRQPTSPAASAVSPAVDAGAAVVVAASEPPADATPIELAAPDAGVLRVASEPPGARIAIDGRDLGETTPATIALDRLAGAPPYDVELRRDGYQTCFIAAVTPGADVVASCALEREPEAKPRFGTIKLFVEPWAEVYLDGRKVGVAPEHRLKLPVGVHRLELVNPVLGRRGSIEVKVPSTRTYRAVLAGSGAR